MLPRAIIDTRHARFDHSSRLPGKAKKEMGADHTTSYVFDESVARDYEAWYEQGFGSFAVRQEEALLHQQLQQFPGATSLLEVGCGTGHFTRWFAKLGFQVIGLDASPAMLEQARLRNGTSYLQGDAQALPFEDQRFDLVAMITTLEFVTDPVQALREAMSVARQGLLLGVLNRHSLLEYMRLLRGQRPVGVLAQAHRRERQRTQTMCATGRWHTICDDNLAYHHIPWAFAALRHMAAMERVPGDVCTPQWIGAGHAYHSAGECVSVRTTSAGTTDTASNSQASSSRTHRGVWFDEYRRRRRSGNSVRYPP